MKKLDAQRANLKHYKKSLASGSGTTAVTGGVNGMREQNQEFVITMFIESPVQNGC